MITNKVNTKQSRDEELERELQEEIEKYGLDKKPEDQFGPEDNLPAKTKEEESWKKRYADLRRHSAQEKTALQKEIADREEKLKSKPKETFLPKKIDKDAILQWKKDYPDVYGIVNEIIMESQESKTAEITSKLEQIEADRLEVQKEKALNLLLKDHPDFLELRETDDFQAWVAIHADLAQEGDKLSEFIYNALWENETDGRSASRAVALYKTEKGKDTSKKKPNPDATTSIRTKMSQEPDVTDGKRRFKESEIDKMSLKQYEALEDEINSAMREGRVDYDMTGAGR